MSRSSMSQGWRPPPADALFVAERELLDRLRSKAIEPLAMFRFAALRRDGVISLASTGLAAAHAAARVLPPDTRAYLAREMRDLADALTQADPGRDVVDTLGELPA